MRRPFDWFCSEILLRQRTGLNYLCYRRLGLPCNTDGKARKAATAMSLSLTGRHPWCEPNLDVPRLEPVFIGPRMKTFRDSLEISCQTYAVFIAEFQKEVYDYHRSEWGPVSPPQTFPQTFPQNLLSERLIIWNMHYAGINKRKYSKMPLVGQSHFLKCRQWSVTWLCLPHNEKQVL